ncbi:uncharacterized protein UV8b_05740 [Ustilaginoidea virens]|uniref:Uncharacterized protein n=1 Tax=Ustilaginoidea virens TaxID=1159556 RepID=A0A8E5MIX7_USTVR|nr:uncharacterized protein UV8b_05740 [Ustilaginoidea virens]QUC21497.1 hypothetical protein UV8b_05740 [Ustilaginoidea virens]
MAGEVEEAARAAEADGAAKSANPSIADGAAKSANPPMADGAAKSANPPMADGAAKSANPSMADEAASKAKGDEAANEANEDEAANKAKWAEAGRWPVVASLPVNTSRLGGPQTNVMAAVAQQAMEEAGTDTAFGYVMPVDTVAFQLASRRFRSHRRRLNPLDSRVYRLLPNYGDSGRVQDVTENSSLTPREIARIRAFFTEPVPELASMHTPAPETPSAPTSVPELASVSVPAPASAPDPAPGPAPAAATAYNAVQPTQRPLRHIIARGQFGEEDEIDYSDDEVQVDADVQGGGGGDRPPQDYDGDSHMNLDAA